MKNLLPVLFALLILSSCQKKEENIAVESVTIDKGKTAEVRLGEALQLKATVLPENATSKEVTWNSSIPLKATVSEGLVTPLEEGETIISATAGGVTDNCVVKVLPKFVAVAGISLNPTTESILIGRQTTLRATIAPENASDQTIMWSSDQEATATVSNGVITAMALGTCQITAKSFSDQTKAAICTVTVVDKEIPVNGISLIPSANILVNHTRQLTPVITPKNTTNTSVTWSTSDANIAEVSTDGVVTAKSLGAATITVASVGNPAKTATCAITVTDREVAVTGITAATTDTTIAVNTSFQLWHKIEPVKATNVNVTYESSDDTKATVSISGWVTAKAIGEASITMKSAADPTKMATCRLFIKARVASITVSPNTVSILAGQKRLLIATVLPLDAFNRTVTWSSTDESKATVSNTGEVTAIALGKVRIIATARDGSNSTGSSTITITTDVTGISLEPTTVSIVLGETSTLKATIAPANANNKKVVWISGQENIATVSEGTIRARAVGTCTITAKSVSDPNKMATCTVTVVAQAIPVTGISIAPAIATILVNETRLLTETITPNNATNKGVTWSTSDATIAEVSTAGVVTAKRVGTATITATSVRHPDKTATCTITVTNREVAVTGITADPTTHTMAVSKTFQLGHKIEPANATNVAVTYVTGNAGIATVSETGLATAVAAGEVTITIKSVADPTKSATCLLTITPAPVLVQTITVSPNTVTLSAGQKQQLTILVMPSNADNNKVAWSSADILKATVSASGEVTALAAGQVVITATANDGSGITGSATVTVRPRVASITIAPENPTVLQDATLELRVTVLPADAVQTVTWSSGDPTKAMINSTTGVVTAVRGGTVTITATATDGSGVKGETRLTVPLPASQAAIHNFIIRSVGFPIILATTPIPNVTLNHAPRSVTTHLDQVPVEIEATAGAIVKIGTTDFTSGQRINCTRTVTFTVTEAGKSGSKQYTLTITPYNKQSNPYGIYTVAHLQDMRNALNEGFKLMNDLTLPGTSDALEIINYIGSGWLPIGDENNFFTGSLDGSGYKIDNLYINRKATKYTGLFGKVEPGGTIKNLEVKTASLGVSGENATGLQYSGILVGKSKGTIENCHTTGVVFSSAGNNDNGYAHAGGLVGANDYAGKIRRCYSSAVVRAKTPNGGAHAFAGGLVGYNAEEITDSYATEDVDAEGATSAYAGGLVGQCVSGKVERCYATGVVKAVTSTNRTDRGAFSGGLMGYYQIRIHNCYAFGRAEASSDNEDAIVAVGGFAGFADSGGRITNSYAIGDVKSFVYGDHTYVGSFLGYNKGSIANCYRNTNAYAVRVNSIIDPSDKDVAGINAKSRADMETDAFKNDVNQGQTVWGRAGGKNRNLPYLIGTGWD